MCEMPTDQKLLRDMYVVTGEWDYVPSLWRFQNVANGLYSQIRSIGCGILGIKKC